MWPFLLSSGDVMITNVISVAISPGIAVAVNAITNVMGGSTQAYADHASLDTRLTSSTVLPMVNIAAGSLSFAGSFGTGIAGSLSASGGATVVALRMERATDAYTNATDIGSTVTNTTP